MDFLSQLLQRIDDTGTNFSETAFGVLGSEVVPLLTIAFYLYVGYYGLQIMMGTASASFANIVGRVCRMLVILLLVSNWGNFNTLFYEWMTTVPENAGRAVLTVSGTGVSEPTSGLSDIWHSANEVAGAYSAQTSIWAILPGVMAAIIWIAAGIFIAIALALLILSKLAMWVLLGTAPIFIACFLFPVTRKYGSGWLDQVILYAIMPLFVYTVAAFMIAAATPELGKMKAAMEANSLQMSDFASFILIVIAGSFVLLNVQSIAASIAGGQAMNLAGATGGLLKGTTRRGAAAGTLAGKLGYRAAATGVNANVNALDRMSSSMPAARHMAQSIKQNSTPRIG